MPPRRVRSRAKNMPCYTPIVGYYGENGNIVFNKNRAYFANQPIELPCHKCIGCKIAKSKDWAIRCWHEAQMHDGGLNNCFITLTYRESDLPENGSLNKPDFQKFLKRLRRNSKIKFRYFMCGEYGEKTHRPHYHAILFGLQFPDKTYLTTRKNNRVYTSKLLEKTWGLGSVEIGNVTFKSAGYVARYLIKKQISTNELQERYCIYDKQTGEITIRPFEYVAMSLRPGIGHSFYEKYPDSFFPHDHCLCPNGSKMPVPNYYRNLLRVNDPDLWDQLRKNRIEKAAHDPNNTIARRETRLSIATKINKTQQPRDYL